MPHSKHKLLSHGGTKLQSRTPRPLNKADNYFLDHLRAQYGAAPFKRGDLDAGRINRLLGRELRFATENQNPFALETLLRVELLNLKQSVPANATAPKRDYRYGGQPTWQIVLEAALSFGRPASTKEIADYVSARVPGFVRTNVRPDLSTVSVNCPSRGHYGNRTPRRTDSGNQYDRLIRIGSGRSVRYAAYDPHIHGVWELVDRGDGVLEPRFLTNADSAELENAREITTTSDFFDPSIDARSRTMVAIVQREGQPAFRRELLRAYGGTCAISGCTIEELLEAAHIVPYLGPQTNVATNALLLRADLHKLFDLHLLAIDPETRTIQLSSQLKDSEYAQYDNVRLRQPQEPSTAPLHQSLQHHRDRCGWLNTSNDEDQLPG